MCAEADWLVLRTAQELAPTLQPDQRVIPVGDFGAAVADVSILCDALLCVVRFGTISAWALDCTEARSCVVNARVVFVRLGRCFSCCVRSAIAVRWRIDLLWGVAAPPTRPRSWSWFAHYAWEMRRGVCECLWVKHPGRHVQGGVLDMGWR